MSVILPRRGFLKLSAAIGCSAAASPLLTPVSLASAPGERRLIVIILRGGMDGLDVLRPMGDRDFASHRPNLAASGRDGLRLTEFHGMHAALKDLRPLWADGDLAFVQATSTPYRDKRSHFDGQDLLEAGTIDLAPMGRRTGWLNRMLPHLPGAEERTAFALGREDMLLLTGETPVSNWSPEVDLTLSSQGLRLLELMMQSDPEMAASMAEAIALAGSDGDSVTFEMSEDAMMDEMMADAKEARKGKTHLKIADFAAEQLRGESRIASFSVGGWDTHANQQRALNGPLERLSEVILRLKDQLGARVWDQTSVLCMTEFGRTVRENGTKGTDHGTGGTMIMAGGAIRGGRIYGEWPGLAEADLYQRRDVMPTSDVRAWAAWAMHDSFGLPKSVFENQVFAGLDMGSSPNLLL
ncbi:DUF1501 domain-containing protein [Cognatishimia activa]|uniref:Twin-arginine translocation pathway signal n=1 Tax=Cognatishimia activa TaxID=1715691 RepID=A0A0N7MBV4_9RHOB|nr:DUF1501 domain-containing protein [Cognatishimia activa]CUI66697.1 hypothetical protein TA5113_01093 [Cognatishimia activa]CUK26456.1 hypothetical protein TA5114_02266 [Cognatishimia activa]